MRCPHRDCDNVQDGAAHRNQRFRCRGCDKRFSTRTDTVMADSNLGFQDWAIRRVRGADEPEGRIGHEAAPRRGDPSVVGAWFLLHRIRETWATRDAEPFAGTEGVEADETYKGGLARTMSAKRRAAVKPRPGPDTGHKTPVVGVKDRGTDRVSARPVPDVSSRSLTGMIAETVQQGARVFTDEWRSDRPLASLGYCHERVEHGAREYVRGYTHTNGIKSLWSMFKTRLPAYTTR